jgi:O-antigen/teichoic acid export membrane protein
MSFLSRLYHSWSKDRLLGRIVKNSGLLFTSNVISAVLSILTANLLGVDQFGALGIVISFGSNINRLLSFRMGDLVVRYLGEFMTRNELDKAGALVKAAGLMEAATSVLAYVVLLIAAPFGAKYIAHDPTTTPLFFLYGVSILGMLTTETATGVLQVGNHFRSQSLINLIQSLVTAGIIFYAYITHSGILVVLVAYLAGKLVAGIGPIWMALVRLNQMLGKNWWKASFKLLPPFKELAKFAVSTNLSGTINMVVRDSELLWVGLLFNTQVAGYYKTALAVINLLIMPINPFISTTYPEIIRSITNKAWSQLKSMLRRVTLIAGGWTVAVGIFLILFGRQLFFTPWIPWQGQLHSIYKEEFLPSLLLLIILLVGFGLANSLYWNRSLLLAFGKPDYPLIVAFWAMVVKVLLTVTVVPILGYQWEAVLLSVYLGVTVILLAGKGLSEIRKAEAGSS